MTTCSDPVASQRVPSDHAGLHGELLAREAELRHYILRKIPPKLQSFIAADDVLQEVWIAAFRSIGGFKPSGPDSFDRWLSTIADRRLVDRIRAAHAERRGGERVPGQERHRNHSSFVALYAHASPRQRTPSREVSAQEVSRAVQVAIAALPDEQREVVWMRHIEGRSVGDVATATRRSMRAVQGLLRRGLDGLRRELGHAERFFSDA